jgi:hypothetical protein
MVVVESHRPELEFSNIRGDRYAQVARS